MIQGPSPEDNVYRTMDPSLNNNDGDMDDVPVTSNNNNSHRHHHHYRPRHW